MSSDGNKRKKQSKPFVQNKKLQDDKNPVNDQIKAKKVLLLDADGNKLGIFDLGEALDMAEKQQKDVVQLGYNPKEQMATAKLIEYSKFLYQQKKQEKERKKNQKSNTLKEIKFGYSISDNDLNIKLKKAQEFIQDGHLVKFVVVLRGRENLYKQTVYEKLVDIANKLANIAKNQGIKEEKNGYSMVLSPK